VVPRVGVLSLQGDFGCHRSSIEALGASAVRVVLPEHLTGLDALVMPGGESTTMLRLMESNGLREPLTAFVRQRPVMGTCAGVILLGVEADRLPHPPLGVLDVGVERNAYGRQIDSFGAEVESAVVGGGYHGVFIRAPRIRRVGPGVEVVATLPGPGGSEGIAGDMRATLSSAREAMGDLAENLEALKHSFFFRGFFKDRGFYDLSSLSPVEYQSKEFEKNVTKERAWVRQDELFTVKANGSEELSDPGRKTLDAMMANFLRFTKDRAVIVEGYAAAGTVDEQFLHSRERATKVRDYLVKKFTLSPDYIGVMPMGAVTEYGDGIALVLLKK